MSMEFTFCYINNWSMVSLAWIICPIQVLYIPSACNLASWIWSVAANVYRLVLHLFSPGDPELRSIDLGIHQNVLSAQVLRFLEVNNSKKVRCAMTTSWVVVHDVMNVFKKIVLCIFKNCEKDFRDVVGFKFSVVVLVSGILITLIFYFGN